jgi:hypothetical protein
MEIQDQSFGLCAVEVQPIDAYTGRNIEEQLPERDIVFEGEVGR